MCAAAKVLQLRCACSYVGVSCICMTVLGVRIAVEEYTVCCTEAMFSGRASSTDGS